MIVISPKTGQNRRELLDFIAKWKLSALINSEAYPEVINRKALIFKARSSSNGSNLNWVSGKNSQNSKKKRLGKKSDLELKFDLPFVLFLLRKNPTKNSINDANKF